jgi:hypothetical protein
MLETTLTWEVRKQVIGIVSDNPNVMLAMFSQLVEEFPNAISVPCTLHVINLMLKDILAGPLVQKLVDKVKKIANYFKSDIGVPSPWLRGMGKDTKVVHGFVSHVETRLYSIAMVCESVYNYMAWLQHIVTQSDASCNPPEAHQLIVTQSDASCNPPEAHDMNLMIEWIEDDMAFASLKEMILLMEPFIAVIPILDASWHVSELRHQNNCN